MARSREEDDDGYDDPPRRRRDRDDDYDDRPRRRRDEDDLYDDGPAPPNYLVPAILTTLLCCTPVGIVAIVYAAQVGSKWASGDGAGARQASDQAKMWCWISFGLGLAVGVGAFALGFLAEAGK